MTWHLQIKKANAWQTYASFEEITGDYAKQVEEGVLRAQESADEARRAAATAMGEFILGKVYPAAQGKPLLRALRHFDEVGLSNDIQAALEEALDGGAEEFSLSRE